MAGLRPGKKRGTSWGEGAAAAGLGFGRAPSFFCKYIIYLFFYRVFGNGLPIGFSLFFWGLSPRLLLLFFHTLRSVFIVSESLRV